MRKNILALVIAAILIGGGAGLLAVRGNHPTTPTATPTATATANPNVISYDGVEGKNALDLLKEKHTVTTKHYDGIGDMVQTIDGKAPDDKHFWAFYVNGQSSAVGASSYTTKAGDKLEWRLDAL